jgi:hypothetical protein
LASAFTRRSLRMVTNWSGRKTSRLPEAVLVATRWYVPHASWPLIVAVPCSSVGHCDTVAAMRIVGVRIGTPIARLLAEILESAGFDSTAEKIAQAIELQVTTEAPLTTADHEAILVALGSRCPPELSRLRRELLEEQRRRRWMG